MNSNKTLVIFRKFENEIIALFPLELGTNNPYDFLSYEHCGQHSAADMLFVRRTKAASPSEYRDLARELRQIGYKLKIGRRIPKNALQKRRNALEIYRN